MVAPVVPARAVIGGYEDRQPAVVRIWKYESASGWYVGCSGSVIGSVSVVSAHHCTSVKGPHGTRRLLCLKQRSVEVQAVQHSLAVDPDRPPPASPGIRSTMPTSSP